MKTRSLLAALLVCALALVGSSAMASGPNAVITNANCQATELAANDDGSSPNVALPFAINFFGNTYSSLWVNNNGNVTFDGPLSEFTPSPILSEQTPIIAPFWADVDTRGTGSGTTHYGSISAGAAEVGGHQAFCVNWIGVGYFGSHTDKLNSFQLVLIDRSDTGAGNFDIEFNYDQVQWETGDASGGSGGLGGSSARVGYSNGTTSSFELPGSAVNGAFLDSNMATGLINNNVNSPLQPGRYVFPVRNGAATGHAITGHVWANTPGTPVSAAIVQACPTPVDTPCRLTQSAPDGSYALNNLLDSSSGGGAVDHTWALTVNPPGGSGLSSGSAGPVSVAGADVSGVDVTLHGPTPIPPGASITTTSRGTATSGVPTIYWQDPIALTVTGCTGGTAALDTATLATDDGLTETFPLVESPPGTYTVTFPAPFPHHGNAHISWTITCGGTTVTGHFDIYIDPSGVVQTTGGTPIPNATVTLLRSDDAGGPFVQVPNGSAIMSPANQNNPDATNASGQFGWDVVTGFYEVQATATNCNTVTSPVLAIPPPATNLVMQLTCSIPNPQHGISFTKGCASSTLVGQPYNCSYTVRNNVDEAGDTLTITGLSDVVHAAARDVNSGNVFSSLSFDAGGTSATCSGPGLMGTGTAADPWTHAAMCTLPFGSRINVHSFSHYSVALADYGLPGHVLRDDAFLTWQDLCDGLAAGPTPGGGNCVASPPNVGAASQTTVTPLQTTTTTAIHNPAHAIVTTVPVGTTVHDLVTVTSSPGNPVPTGNVTVDWFTNGTCAGAPVATSAPTPLNAAGQADVTGFTFTVGSAGQRAFLAHYSGDVGFAASDGTCEPLSVVDAQISITPNGTNRVGQTHTFTAHVSVNDGSGAGFVNAPDGTAISFTKDSGPGALGGPNPCTTEGGTGSCTITLTSATTGVTTVSAHTTVSVGGVSLTRNTDGTGGSSGPATKTWVNVAIAIAPSATNEVGHAHTFTVTVTQDPGTGTFGPASGASVTVTCTASNGAAAAGPFTGTTNASGQFMATVNSSTAGKLTCHASATLSVGASAPFTVQTDGAAPNSGDATKTWVDASIQITPATATNPVGTNHVLTGHVSVNLGDGAGFVNAPAGTTITFSLSNAGGATATFVGPSSCTTSGSTGSCTVTISSPTAGTTTIHATTTLAVGGVALTRATGDTHAGDSADATKIWQGGGGGLITETNVDCTDVLSGNASNFLVSGVNYANSKGLIGQGINPGKFYYWAKITTTTANQVVTVTQSNDSANHSAPFLIHQGWDRVYTGNCGSWTAGTEIAGGAGATFTIATPGSYVIGIKYDPKSLAGTPVPVPATVKYTFTTSLGAGTSASVNLQP
jgi:hypothetical protein